MTAWAYHVGLRAVSSLNVETLISCQHKMLNSDSIRGEQAIILDNERWKLDGT